MNDMVELLVPRCDRCGKQKVWQLHQGSYFCWNCKERPCECWDNGVGYPGQVQHPRGYVDKCGTCGGTGRLYG